MKPPIPHQRTTEKPKECIVFTDSPAEEISHAKSFWKSLTLQPPLESRLVSADIRQRLRVAIPPEKQKTIKPTTSWEETKTAVFLHHAMEQKKAADKAKYAQLSSQREAALNLLHKQRMERLQKEMISIPYKPQKKIYNYPETDDYILDEL